MVLTAQKKLFSTHPTPYRSTAVKRGNLSKDSAPKKYAFMSDITHLK